VLEFASEKDLLGFRRQHRSVQKESILPEVKVVMNPGTSASTHILSGWKDIANYLGKGVRTVQRYEGELHLPVRRPAGRARGSVVATKVELDTWVAASPVRDEFQIDRADPLCAVSRAAVREGIREMRTLQEQMKGLRAEMRHSIFSLQQNLETLKGGVGKTESYSILTSALVDGARCGDLVVDLIAYPGLPKAS